MNTLISIYAWSPLTISAIAVVWAIYYRGFVKNHPWILVAIGVFIVVYFFFNLFSASWISKAANCTRFDAGSAEGCMLYGQDVSKSMYNFAVLPWLGILILPVGGYFIAGALIVMFGWINFFKIFAAVIFFLALIQVPARMKENERQRASKNIQDSGNQ